MDSFCVSSIENEISKTNNSSSNSSFNNQNNSDFKYYNSNSFSNSRSISLNSNNFDNDGDIEDEDNIKFSLHKKNYINSTVIKATEQRNLAQNVYLLF